MNYRETKSAYLNCEKRMFIGDGEFDIPFMRPVDGVNLDGCEAIGFNYAIGCKHPENKVLHFHLDDYQFERVWNNPEEMWYFDGIPRNSMVSVSTVGGFKSKKTKEGWLEGFRRALSIMQPSKLLVFGKLWPEVEESFDGEFIVMDNKNLTRKTTLSRKTEKGVSENENDDRRTD